MDKDAEIRDVSRQINDLLSELTQTVADLNMILGVTET